MEERARMKTTSVVVAAVSGHGARTRPRRASLLHVPTTSTTSAAGPGQQRRRHERRPSRTAAGAAGNGAGTATTTSSSGGGGPTKKKDRHHQHQHSSSAATGASPKRTSKSPSRKKRPVPPGEKGRSGCVGESRRPPPPRSRRLSMPAVAIGGTIATTTSTGLSHNDDNNGSLSQLVECPGFPRNGYRGGVAGGGCGAAPARGEASAAVKKSRSADDLSAVVSISSGSPFGSGDSVMELQKQTQLFSGRGGGVRLRRTRSSFSAMSSPPKSDGGGCNGTETAAWSSASDELRQRLKDKVSSGSPARRRQSPQRSVSSGVLIRQKQQKPQDDPDVSSKPDPGAAAVTADDDDAAGHAGGAPSSSSPKQQHRRRAGRRKSSCGGISIDAAAGNGGEPASDNGAHSPSAATARRKQQRRRSSLYKKKGGTVAGSSSKARVKRAESQKAVAATEYEFGHVDGSNEKQSSDGFGTAGASDVRGAGTTSDWGDPLDADPFDKQDSDGGNRDNGDFNNENKATGVDPTSAPPPQKARGSKKPSRPSRRFSGSSAAAAATTFNTRNTHSRGRGRALVGGYGNAPQHAATSAAAANDHHRRAQSLQPANRARTNFPAIGTPVFGASFDDMSIQSRTNDDDDAESRNDRSASFHSPRKTPPSAKTGNGLVAPHPSTPSTRSMLSNRSSTTSTNSGSGNDGQRTSQHQSPGGRSCSASGHPKRRSKKTPTATQGVTSTLTPRTTTGCGDSSNNTEPTCSSSDQSLGDWVKGALSMDNPRRSPPSKGIKSGGRQNRPRRKSMSTAAVCADNRPPYSGAQASENRAPNEEVSVATSTSGSLAALRKMNRRASADGTCFRHGGGNARSVVSSISRIQQRRSSTGYSKNAKLIKTQTLQW